MWIFASRGRPQGLRDVIECWHKTKASTNVLLFIDHDDPSLAEYLTIVLPPTWVLRINNPRRLPGQIMNEAFAEFPDDAWYGGLADDTMPLTDYWDIELIKSCLPDKIAYPDDMIQGEALCTFPVIGGDLVREMGFFILPGLERLYGDNVWRDIGKKRNCLVYRGDVVLEHRHFSVGKMAFDETAKKPNADKDREIYEAWMKEYAPQSPIHVVCVNVGNYCGRGVEYVNILADAVQRNLPDAYPGTFTVFTDQLDEAYGNGVTQQLINTDLSGWWNKLYLFKKGLFPEGERVVYFDLDTAVVGGLDKIFEYKGNFAILEDFWRPGGLGSGVMMWKSGKNHELWDYFELAAQHYCDSVEGGDQAFIENVFRQINYKPDILQNLFPNQFLSYKTHARVGIPQHAKVICFHGHPRPHEVTDYWVPHIWKIGGGSIFNYEMVCNSTDREITENISQALAMDCELLADQYAVDKTEELLIVGGGPSLEHSLLEISIRKKRGAIIWAMNGSFRYLSENGIEPHAHVMLDAREDNIGFLPEKTDALLLYCVQCHPSILQKATAIGRLILWCPSIRGIMALLGNRRAAIISAGSSVGLKALGLAQLFGFKKLHLYGYDSSYKDGLNHAYAQPLNDNERIIDITVHERSFKCAPWMASQVEEFKRCLPGFMENGIEIMVHGDGLLPYTATLIT